MQESYLSHLQRIAQQGYSQTIIADDTRFNHAMLRNEKKNGIRTSTPMIVKKNGVLFGWNRYNLYLSSIKVEQFAPLMLLIGKMKSFRAKAIGSVSCQKPSA